MALDRDELNRRRKNREAQRRRQRRATQLRLAIALVVLIAAAAGLLFLSGLLEEVTAFLTALSDRGGVSHRLLTPLYKTVGIALVVKVGSERCRDAGEAALASVVETAGAVCALLVALPLLGAVVDLLMELMT